MTKMEIAPELAQISASIDYRLRAKSIVGLFRRGNIYKSDICDAHPELLKAAKGAGEPCEQACPICAKKKLVTVRYMFGRNLGPGGRCLEDIEELQRIARRKKGVFTCYVVEVCTGCSWNFLVQSFPIIGKI